MATKRNGRLNHVHEIYFLTVEERLLDKQTEFWWACSRLADCLQKLKAEIRNLDGQENDYAKTSILREKIRPLLDQLDDLRKAVMGASLTLEITSDQFRKAAADVDPEVLAGFTEDNLRLTAKRDQLEALMERAIQDPCELVRNGIYHPYQRKEVTL